MEILGALMFCVGAVGFGLVLSGSTRRTQAIGMAMVCVSGMFGCLMCLMWFSKLAAAR